MNPMAPLVLRLEKGSAITAVENKKNLDTIRDYCNALAALLGVSFNDDGTLKTGTINDVDQITDRVITRAKLAWLWAMYGTAIGTNNYSVTINPTTDFAYAAGLVLFVEFTNANTSASCTLDVNSAGQVAIRKNGASALEVGDIQAGQTLILVHDGTQFQALGVSPQTGTSALTNSAFWMYKSYGVPLVLDGSVQTLEYDDIIFDETGWCNATTHKMTPTGRAVWWFTLQVNVDVQDTTTPVKYSEFKYSVYDFTNATELITGYACVYPDLVAPNRELAVVEVSGMVMVESSHGIGATIELLDPDTYSGAETRCNWTRFDGYRMFYV